MHKVARVAEHSGWKKFRHRLEWLAVSTLAALVPLLPRSICYYIARMGGAAAAHLDSHGRKVALENLRLAFRDQLTPERRRRIVGESYQQFAATMIDLFWSPRLMRENFRKCVEFDEVQFRELGIGPHDPVVLGCYHYGNFEWFSITAAWLGYEGAIIAQEFKNPLLDPIFKRLRERSGHQMVTRDRGIIRLFKNVRRGGRCAVLIDLTISPKIPSVAIECFGLKTNVTFAHAWLHQQTGAPLITAYCEPLPRGRYRVVLRRPKFSADATLQQIAQACWDEFEPQVRKNPAPWMWMYKHWRYRPGVAKREEYPFYANFSEDFEVRLHESGFPAILRNPNSPTATDLLTKPA